MLRISGSSSRGLLLRKLREVDAGIIDAAYILSKSESCCSLWIKSTPSRASTVEVDQIEDIKQRAD